MDINSEKNIVQSCLIAERYGFSFYDSLIVSAAIDCNCTILFSEDLQHGQLINEIHLQSKLPIYLKYSGTGNNQKVYAALKNWPPEKLIQIQAVNDIFKR